MKRTKNSTKRSVAAVLSSRFLMTPVGTVMFGAGLSFACLSGSQTPTENRGHKSTETEKLGPAEVSSVVPIDFTQANWRLTEGATVEGSVLTISGDGRTSRRARLPVDVEAIGNTNECLAGPWLVGMTNE